MNNSLTNEITRLVEKALGESMGSPTFNIVAGIGLVSLILCGWLVANFTCSSRKGLIRSVSSQVAPVLVAVIVWAVLLRHAVPSIEQANLKTIVPIGGAVVSGLLASLLITRPLLQVSSLASVLSNLITYACVAAIVAFGGTLVRDMDSSLQGLEENKLQRESDTRSITEPD